MSVLGRLRRNQYRLRAIMYVGLGLVVAFLASRKLADPSSYQRFLAILSILLAAIGIAGGVIRWSRPVSEKDSDAHD